MKFTEEERKDFYKVVDAVIKWLNDNTHPHTSVIITPTGAELVEGIISRNTHAYVRD